MPLSDYNEVLAARAAADKAAESALMRPLEPDENPVYAAVGLLVMAIEAFRLELRALGVTTSYAISEQMYQDATLGR